MFRTLTSLMALPSVLAATACSAAGEDPGGVDLASTARPAAATTAPLAPEPDPSWAPTSPPTPPIPAQPVEEQSPDTGRSNDLAVTFDWPDVDPSSGSCDAGFYQGGFDGLYASGLTFVGAPIPVTGDVNMFLERSPNGEFLVIKNGAVCGVADGLFPFYGDLEGELDCETGVLSAHMIGGYLVGPIPGPFEGDLLASYDFISRTLVGGTWCLKEGGAAAPNECAGGAWPLPYGGSGNWGATWLSDTPGVPCEKPVGL